MELASFYLPGILLGSFDGQSNAFVFAVNLLHQYGYFVAFLSNVSSLSGAVPSQLSVVNQANQTSANFYKQTKFSNLNNLAGYYLTFFNGCISSFFSSSACFLASLCLCFLHFLISLSLSFTLSLQQVATGNNNAFLFQVNFDNFSLQLLADVRSEILNTAQLYMASGHKAFNAFNCNCQANDVLSLVLDDAQNLNGCFAFFAFSQLGNILPSCIALSLNLGQTNEIALGAARNNLSFNFIANLDGFHQFFGSHSRVPFGISDQAIMSISKRYINAVFIQLNNGTVDNFARIYLYLHTFVEHAFKIHVFHCYNSLLN